MGELKKTRLPCVCITCGVKNDFTNPTGLCQNNHDNWLEYRDLFHQDADPDPASKACSKFKLSLEELKIQFLNPNVTSIKIPKQSINDYGKEVAIATAYFSKLATEFKSFFNTIDHCVELAEKFANDHVYTNWENQDYEETLELYFKKHENLFGN